MPLKNYILPGNKHDSLIHELTIKSSINSFVSKQYFIGSELLIPPDYLMILILLSKVMHVDKMWSLYLLFRDFN